MNAPEHAADVREWLKRAGDDLRWAIHSFGGGFLPQACFACQQAAEKALKAYLLVLDLPLRRTHSLTALVEEIRAVDPDAGVFRDSATVLDVYYAPTRYADVPAELDYTAQRVEDAIERAQALVEWLQVRIEERLTRDSAGSEQ